MSRWPTQTQANDLDYEMDHAGDADVMPLLQVAVNGDGECRCTGVISCDNDQHNSWLPPSVVGE